ncbi:MAG: response regulator transcription factor [Peptococcaceae bacterium]|nr:response regulator transcription factor [Peptococcaceae bacterium]MDR2736399.1 response regulator transcription factor [Gracilibacteraceae bacterium]
MIEIVIVDDHPLFRDGIRAALAGREEFVIVAEAGDGQGAINTARRVKMDMLLLDINMPGVNGFEACQIIRREYPDIKIVVLTADESENFYGMFQQIGVAGYFFKSISAVNLVAYLNKISRGEPVPAPAVSKEVLKEVAGMKCNFGLTPRELAILKLVTMGESNRDIGIALYISEKTVKNHLSKIFRKMQVEDRTQAALKAVKLKMIETN